MECLGLRGWTLEMESCKPILVVWVEAAVTVGCCEGDQGIKAGVIRWESKHIVDPLRIIP